MHFLIGMILGMVLGVILGFVLEWNPSIENTKGGYQPKKNEGGLKSPPKER